MSWICGYHVSWTEPGRMKNPSHLQRNSVCKQGRESLHSTEPAPSTPGIRIFFFCFFVVVVAVVFLSLAFYKLAVLCSRVLVTHVRAVAASTHPVWSGLDSRRGPAEFFFFVIFSFTSLCTGSLEADGIDSILAWGVFYLVWDDEFFHLCSNVP